MADINFEGTNLLGEPFKEYVDSQILARQSLLGALNKDNEVIAWENGKSAYVALASSINVDNSVTLFETEANAQTETPEPNFQFVKGLDGQEGIFINVNTPTPNSSNDNKQVITSYSSPNSEGINKIKSLELEGDPNQYLENFLANNLVLFGGTAYYEIDSSGSYSNPYYRSGIATKNSILNKAAYGFGGSSFGLAPLPGITSFNLKSRNMGSLREATVVLRANSDDQFKLIDTLYCRIGYTMFIEWGNSIYYNNRLNYISNPPSDGVTSLIPTFLSKTHKSNTIIENPQEFIELIEKRREQSSGNYDAFFGKVKNFRWEFNKNGYYEITLSLASQGDIIESLKIDGSYSSQVFTTSSLADIPIDNNSALTSFLSIVAEPNETKKVVQQSYAMTSQEITTENSIYDVSKFQLVAQKEESKESKSLNLTTFSSSSIQSPSDTIPELNYTRLSSSLGQIASANAVFGEEKQRYFYIRLGDILDFIKDKLLIYNSLGDFEPILDIDTDTDRNVMYCPEINVSADPSKVMVRTDFIPFIKDTDVAGTTINSLNYDAGLTYDIRQSSIFSTPGAELQVWKTPLLNGELGVVHGKIMNIYFEYQYLLDTIQNLRDEETGSITLFDFLKDLCDTANNCLGGVNKLSVRLEDDRVVRIYDQTPIYGAQVKDKDFPDYSTPINLYGIKPRHYTNELTGEEGVFRDGSFVTDFSIKTELTNDFATIVTIGAQAQGSTVTEDSTGLSAWNNGLIDRWFPGKIDGTNKDGFDNVEARIENIIKKLKTLWLGYSSGRLDTVEFKNEFFSRLFVSGNITVTGENIYNFKNFPKKDQYSNLVKLQKDFLQQLIIYENLLVNTARVKNGEIPVGTNQIGMIPLNISVTMDGLSGIKIYNRLRVDSRFLPSYYPRTLIWVIKGVSHEIINNKWFTKLETLAYPKLPEQQHLQYLIDRNTLNIINEEEITGRAGTYTFEELSVTDKPYPNTPPINARQALTQLDINVLTPITNEFGRMLISSAYRSPAVNTAVGSTSSSQHLKGEAADFTSVAGGKPLNEVFTWIADNLVFGQLIWELGTDSNPTWIHVSYSATNNNKGEILRYDGSSYEPCDRLGQYIP